MDMQKIGLLKFGKAQLVVIDRRIRHRKALSGPILSNPQDWPYILVDCVDAAILKFWKSIQFA